MAQQVFEFICDYPGVWTNADLADRFARTTPSICSYLKILKVQGRIKSQTKRQRIGSVWVVRRHLSVVQKQGAV